MRRNLIETILGAVVLLIALLFISFAYKSAKIKTTEGYAVNALFSNVGGLQSGADVRLSGVKIGSVSALTLDEASYRAKVDMIIQPDIKLPKDSSASISASGLLGDTFINIIPGGDEENLQAGERITMTQPSVDLVEMLGKFVFSAADSKAAPVPPSAPAPPVAAPEVPQAEVHAPAETH